MTDQANPRETYEETSQSLPDGKLLELVRFLARAAAETDFQEQMKQSELRYERSFCPETQEDCRPQEGHRS